MASSQTTSGTDSDPPEPTSLQWCDTTAKQNSSRLSRRIKNERRHHVTVTAIKAILFAVRGKDAVSVVVPSVQDDYPIDLDSIRPQVWFCEETGNDWNATPRTINWTENIVQELNGTKLTRSYAVYTESTCVGKVNAPIYKLTAGQPCFGNVLLVRLAGDNDQYVDDMDEEDFGMAAQVVHCLLKEGKIGQGPVVLAAKKKTA